ncbi:unnamed protein product [Notodromas monacha]|uniref:Fibroblast growth factor n=1 Tax=Notodromas monacha TaxID=399045 RepID=A0A7R9BWS4_9CRUS|nr:unnamed protein product [Notodromas monacha]CAG0923217.1 unnamed protein product [Notodromas monacha]
MGQSCGKENDSVSPDRRRSPGPSPATPGYAGSRRGLRPSWPATPTPTVEEPQYRQKLQLYCRTGYNIAVFADGTVRGTREPFLPHAKMELIVIAHVSDMQFRGLETGLYLAMDKKGRLYGEANPNDEATVWVEVLHGVYNCYLSRKYAHLGWYLAVKKNGKPKRATKAWWGQKAIQFLPRPSSPI